MPGEIIPFRISPSVSQPESSATPSSSPKPPINLMSKSQQRALTNAYLAYETRENALISANPQLIPVRDGRESLPASIIPLFERGRDVVPSLESLAHEGFGLTPAEEEASARSRRLLWREPSVANPDPDYDC